MRHEALRVLEKPSGFDVVVTIEAPSSFEAWEIWEKYLDNYHPAGYRTQVTSAFQDGTTYRIKGTRYRSCD
jgi:hypothetical protein